jgi:hypothetical protein
VAGDPTRRQQMTWPLGEMGGDKMGGDDMRYTILCGARLMRTGRRDVCFGLFLLRFDEGNKCQSHMGGLNMIYRRYGGWLSRARRCLLAGLHRIGAWTQSVPEMWPEGAGAPTRGCGVQVANRNRWLCRWWTGGTAHHVSSCDPPFPRQARSLRRHLPLPPSPH